MGEPLLGLRKLVLRDVEGEVVPGRRLIARVLELESRFSRLDRERLLRFLDNRQAKFL